MPMPRASVSDSNPGKHLEEALVGTRCSASDLGLLADARRRLPLKPLPPPNRLSDKQCSTAGDALELELHLLMLPLLISLNLGSQGAIGFF